MGRKDVNDLRTAQWSTDNADNAEDRTKSIQDEIAAANKITPSDVEELKKSR